MKEINELDLPDDVRYAKDHEWVRSEGDRARIGLSDYAQEQLGDIVFVELPQSGDSFRKGEEFGTVESVKAVAELYMPISGEILSVNKALEESPELINENPYNDGWMIEVKPGEPTELDSLMTRVDYLEMLKGIE
ncbi:MAG: glycine cleavage system protein GcvH [Deltaproteobacteria bacterium]|nr:glycine cleavage system protein GcvH [Deltaproteobacteria bacterium]